jgi:hypothetical protein
VPSDSCLQKQQRNGKEKMKRFSISFVGLTLVTVVAVAQEAAALSTPPAPGCSAQAAEKKLAGAALNSFMKKM